MSIEFIRDPDSPHQTRIIIDEETVGYYLQNGDTWQAYKLPKTLIFLQNAAPYPSGLSESEFQDFLRNNLLL